MDATSAAHTKQWVFVDEYNRHKRLKVMRACDGCRKRKIRCDGALNNGPWPCGACVRLKLRCVPPTLDQDEEQDLAPGPGQFVFHRETPQSTSTDKQNHSVSPLPPQHSHEWDGSVLPPRSSLSPTSQPSYRTTMNQKQQQQHRHQQQSTPLSQHDNSYETSYSESPYVSASPSGPVTFYRQDTELSLDSASTSDPQEVDATVRELSGQMGDLTIDSLSVAPYIVNERRTLAETPAVEEAEYILPPSVTSDATARIPLEMMPSEERVLDYFGYFFDYIHPYIPVLNRAALYEQWRTARHSISPLILEGIFACVARYLEEHLEVQKWLALASRHEESFKDVPRVSTIQGMILLMKARESISKRGYYYRSWMAVKYMTNMAVDLGMHEHYDLHRSGNCRLAPVECDVRRRIWQTIFTLEIIVGAPQGRTDFAVDVDTVDCTPAQQSPNSDPFEHLIGRRWTYMTQASRNIKLSNIIWQKLRRERKDWALDASFARRNEELASWLRLLPSDMRLHFPEDDSPPWLGGNHIIAYIYIWHYLVVLMHHRPQLQALLEAKDQRFRIQLEICTQAAGMMCRVQEALIRDFGPHGLQFMLRGVNFTIYSILTCTMLHLAAITSPDPVQNSHARIYFSRHMRVLEHCLPSANTEMQAQINTLREAFSRDTSQPFELKPTLGLRSPSVASHPTPPSVRDSPQAPTLAPQQAWSPADASSIKPTTPVDEFNRVYATAGVDRPLNSFTSNPSYVVPQSHSFAPQPIHGVPTTTNFDMTGTIPGGTMPVWDPSGIFAQWNVAFGSQSAAHGQGAMPDPRFQGTPTSMLTPQSQQSPSGTRQMYSPSDLPPQQLIPEPVAPAVTQLMWQDAFTTAYVSGHGQKRYREASIDVDAYNGYVKRRG